MQIVGSDSDIHSRPKLFVFRPQESTYHSGVTTDCENTITIIVIIMSIKYDELLYYCHTTVQV